MNETVVPPALVKLAPVLDLKAAVPLAEQLLTVRGSHLQIDASEVERLGSQCLQVLLSARLTWDADQKTMTIEQPSEAMQMTVARLGASNSLFTSAEKV